MGTRMLISKTFREIFEDFLREIAMETQEFRVFCETGHWNSLEHLNIFEEKRKMGSLKALYKGRK